MADAGSRGATSGDAEPEINSVCPVIGNNNVLSSCCVVSNQTAQSIDLCCVFSRGATAMREDGFLIFGAFPSLHCKPGALPFLSRNGHCAELSFADGGGAEAEKIRSDLLV